MLLLETDFPQQSSKQESFSRLFWQQRGLNTVKNKVEKTGWTKKTNKTNFQEKQGLRKKDKHKKFPINVRPFEIKIPIPIGSFQFLFLVLYQGVCQSDFLTLPLGFSDISLLPPVNSVLKIFPHVFHTKNAFLF